MSKIVRAVTQDWSALGFNFIPTGYNVRCRCRNGKWGKLQLCTGKRISIHMADPTYYGQELFEGIQAYKHQDGRVFIFRPQESARRMTYGCEKIHLHKIPENIFMEAVQLAVAANADYVPPYGTGSSLYIRPYIMGTGPQVGLGSAKNALFIVFVNPVGPYFKHGFKPIRVRLEQEYDRAAPNGTGDIKLAGNYAAGLRAMERSKALGYTGSLYLDAKEKEWVDELDTSNFFGIKQGQYLTPASTSILRSVTNMSLQTIATELGMNPKKRPIHKDELRELDEAGCCGTAAVVAPVGSIFWEKDIPYSKNGKAGEICTALYNRLIAIRTGDREDRYDWLHEVEVSQ